VVVVAFVLVSPLAALAVERAIRQLTLTGDVTGNGAGRRLLPWQVEPASSRLRVLMSGCAPFLLAAAALRFDAGPAVIVSVVLLAFLICAATDLLCYRVPDVVTYPGTVLVLAAAAVLPEGDLEEAALGALTCGGIFLSLTLLTRGGFGLADGKLAAFIGATLGLVRAVDAVVLGVVIGGLCLLSLVLIGAVSLRQVTPYAPFLVVAAIAVTLLRGAAFAPL
jgi:prepilin signal peptidase PulO-like enzyme (type II secretory pathway)